MAVASSNSQRASVRGRVRVLVVSGGGRERLDGPKRVGLER